MSIHLRRHLILLRQHRVNHTALAAIRAAITPAEVIILVVAEAMVVEAVAATKPISSASLRGALFLLHETERGVPSSP